MKMGPENPIVLLCENVGCPLFPKEEVKKKNIYFSWEYTRPLFFQLIFNIFINACFSWDATNRLTKCLIRTWEESLTKGNS